MNKDQVARRMQATINELRTQARLPFRLLPDKQSSIAEFADSIANQIRTRNARSERTTMILPVGPVAQYRILVDHSNRERVSWKNVFTFNMDEFLDWQGRPIPVSHPLSFEGYMRREVFGRLDEELRIPESQCLFPHPFRIDEIGDKIQELGGIDACYGGIGYHGHVALNEPPISRWYRI
jgi:glucosamine-6-phosphate deaminase